MGMNKTANQNSNLTWIFLVDSCFTYMLRLHFCELDPNIDYTSNRLFDIYIADQLAEESANVLNWGKGRGVPVYRDYAILISGHKKTTLLSLNLHPSSINSEYSDAFLNGLEIFKISDLQTNSLAGPNPDPLPQSFDKTQINSQNSCIATKILVAAAVGTVSSLILLSFVAFFLIKHHFNSNKTSTASTSAIHGLSLPSELCRYFSISEIRAATNNFDQLFIIGVGGFGHVYKGYIDDGQTPVAIKRLKPGSQQGAHEFRTEIEMLSQLRHRHLVSLIGYSIASNEMILVYEFMARGTLSEYLYNNTQNPSLPWKQRLRICIDAALGLHYLHAGATHPIIHRDIKSTNILLDEKWVAKVSDFGLSKFGPMGLSKSYVSTVVKGSVGYLDPEYYKRQHLTVKSDVYSFGVVLFEVLGGRPPWMRTMNKRQVLLSDWAKHCCCDMERVGEIVDPVLKLKGNYKIAPLCLKKFVEVGLSCLSDNGAERPSMNDVVGGLELALKLQEEAEQHKSGREEDDVEGQNEESCEYEYGMFMISSNGVGEGSH